MSLLSNIAYQFFFASQPQRSADLEKGPEPDRDGSLQGQDEPEERARDIEEYDVEGDDNEIIQELEREEYPDRPPRRRPFSQFPTWSSFSSRTTTFPSGLGQWWSKVRARLDPSASQANLESFSPHYRYLPIISGIVIPFSILLEIPGLIGNWYIRTEANQTIASKKNTPILDVGLAFSMVFAVLANICLISRFMEKNVKLMTILCVIFLTIHDIINIIAVTIFGVEHRFNDGFTYGQAFWMVVCSTSVSTFTNITLIIDIIRTPDFANSGSGLTHKQRSLVISVMVLMCYIAFGSLVQSFLLKLSFTNALYFTVVAIETIGFGDIVPSTTGARIFICLYALFGIVNLALTVGLARESIIEGIEIGYRKRVKAVRLRRKTIQRDKRIFQRWRAAVEFHLHENSQPIWVNDTVPRRPFLTRLFGHVWAWPVTINKIFGKHRHHHYATASGDYPHPHGMHLNIEALSWPQLEGSAMEAGVPLHTLLPPGFKASKQPNVSVAGVFNPGTIVLGAGAQSALPVVTPEPSADVPLTHARLGRMVTMLGNFGFAFTHSQLSPKVPKQIEWLPAPVNTRRVSSARPKISIAEQYDSLRASMETEEKRAFYVRLVVVWVMFMVFWTVGSGIFMVTEKWTYGEALYFCFVTFMTIGFGDLAPQTPAGRSIFVVWALLGVATMTVLISIISEAYSSRYKRAFHSNIYSRAVQHYRERMASERRPPQSPPFGPTVIRHDFPAVSNEEAAFSPISIDDANLNSRKRAEGQLEALPRHILHVAKSLNENVRYLIGEAGAAGKDMPDGLKELMDDVAGVERLGERTRREILQDSSARHTLLSLSIEQSLRKLMQAAEETVKAVDERDDLVKLSSPTEDITTRADAMELEARIVMPDLNHSSGATLAPH